MPTDDLEAGDWVRTDTSVETVFSLPGMDVQSASVRYEDEQTRNAMTEALDRELDVPPRFFAGTRLVFEPPLPPGSSPRAIASLLRTSALSTFASRLRERGLIGVERNSSRRLRVGKRTTRVTRFDAAIPLQDRARDLPLACWVAAWTTSEDAIVVTGGHPTVSLAAFFDLDTSDQQLTRSGESYREEFVSLLRGVE